MHDELNSELYSDLRELSAASFPKVCSTCGRVYETLDDFLRETQAIPGRSGLKASVDDDERPTVEVFRNCVCGSTLMDVCLSRRDESEQGRRRRESFERTLAILVARGVVPETARAELLNVVRGNGSELINRMLNKNKK